MKGEFGPDGITLVPIGSEMEFPDILPVECEVRGLSLAVKPLSKTWSICRPRDVKAPVTSILKNVSFNISAGSFMAIMGPSGSGKVLKFVVNTNWRPVC